MGNLGHKENIDYDELYFQEISKISVLSKEELTEMFMDYENSTGNKKTDIKNKIVTHNLKLVIYAAKNYIGKGVEFKDLIEEGNIALIEAVDKYDYRYDSSFSAFAIYAIKCKIRRYLDRNSKCYKIPSYVSEKLHKYRKCKSALSHKLGREATLKDIAEALKIPLNKVFEYEKYCLADLHFVYDASISMVEGGIYIDSIADKNSEIENIPDKLLVEQLYAAFDMCDIKPRDIEIIKMRYGFNDNEPKSMDKVAAALNVSKTTVKNSEEKTVKKLKKAMTSKRKYYLNFV